MRRIAYSLGLVYCLIMTWYYSEYSLYTDQTAREFPAHDHVYWMVGYIIIAFCFYVLLKFYGRTKEEKIMYIGIIINRALAMLFNIYAIIADVPLVWEGTNHIMVAACLISLVYLIRGSTKSKVPL